MANSVSSKDRYTYVTIDTAPGAAGYWCESVSMAAKNATPLFFSRRGTGEGTVTIQYKCQGDSDWQDLTTDIDLVNGVRCVIDDEARGVAWRAGIKSGNYSSGTIVLGLDW